MREVRHAFVETRGFPTHVAEAGRGAPLFLLHGWPEFWATWEPMFERLPDRFRLIAPDFRGFGESGNPTTGASDQAGPDVSPTISWLSSTGWASPGQASSATMSVPM